MRSLASILLLVSVFLSATCFAEETRLKGPKNVDYGKQGRMIGPIKPTDTLWRIALKIRPDNSVSVYQVMHALYEKNPKSFLDKNINHIRIGSYLKIPSMQEIHTIQPELAKQKSDQDDTLWEKKRNGNLSNSEIDLVAKKITQAKKSDVDEAKEELKTQLTEITKNQSKKLADLKNKFKESVENSKVILDENEKLQTQLNVISGELDSLKGQLGNDSKIQQNLRELLAQQNEFIMQQKAAEMERNKGINWTDPILIALYSTIPAILLIWALISFFRNRKKSEAPTDETIFEKPVADVPAPPPFEPEVSDLLDSEPDLNDSLEDDLLEDDSIQLDDSLEDDGLPEPDEILYEEDEPDLDFDELDGDSLLNQDELDGLLSDDIVFENDSDDLVPDFDDTENTQSDLLDNDDIDAFLQQDFEQPASEIDEDIISDDLSVDDMLTETDIALDIPEDLEPAANENAQDDDVDALLDSVEFDEEQVEVNVDVDDIDALLDGANDDTDTSNTEDSEITVDLDDIDALLDGSNDVTDVPDVNDSEIAADLDVGSDDIDALLDGVSDESDIPDADDAEVAADL
ncbi:FimV/HubP family polar landmark protein, partial [Pseudoalteromonas denitrificans]